MEKNIKQKLTKHCSFLSVIDDIDHTAASKRMMGMTTSNYEFLHWKTAWTCVHQELVTLKRWMEMLRISKALLEAFPTPSSLQVFCSINAESTPENQYNLFMEGQEANYWISASTNPGSCQIKLHSLTKEGF